MIVVKTILIMTIKNIKENNENDDDSINDSNNISAK